MSAPLLKRNARVYLGTLLALLATLGICGCGGGSSSTTQTIAPAAQNVQPITVDGGPLGDYEDGAFTSVTICLAGTTTCQTIDGVLVDTGSVGLRLLASAVTLSLPQQQASDGNAVGECTQFVDGSYIWGPVATADIKLAGEVASSSPIQLLESNFFTIPSSCSSGGGPEEDTLQGLGANGIIGVGPYSPDCGSGCAIGISPPAPFYYECSSASGCQPAFVSEAQQVQNPVALFATDNNGVVIELPSVSGAVSSVSGSMVFGIGTESNNALGSATVQTLDPSTFNITTTYKGTAYTNAAYIDSGSNGYFFLDSGTTGIANCTTNIGFYCPSSSLNLTAANQGANGNTTQISFSVANADQEFASSADNAFNNLGGPNPGGFDWGLPFFFGRNVFTAIAGKSTPGGAGPYWAY